MACSNDPCSASTGEEAKRQDYPGCGKRQKLIVLLLGLGRIDHAFGMAKYFAATLEGREGFHLVSENPPPCLQV